MRAATVLQAASSLAAIGSAALWWWSARVKTPDAIKIDAMAITTAPLDPVPGSEIASPVLSNSDDLRTLADALRQQSKLNRWAAGLTGLAVALQLAAPYL